MPTKKKTQQPKANTTKKVVKKKNTLKNKNIVDTKVKNIVPMVKKKVNQKIKNVKNSTPKQLVKKVANNTKRIVNNALSDRVKLAKKIAKTVEKSFRDSKPLSKSPKPRMRSNFGPKY